MPTHPTSYPHVNQLIEELLARLQGVLGDDLVGLYLYGSPVLGDYDDGLSDIDLLAAVKNDLDTAQFDALDAMHNDIVARFPAWDDRIEIAYLSLNALKTFKIQSSPIGIISPGEPFNIKQAGIEWLMNWYQVREYGVTLFGPPPTTIIEPTSKAEYLEAVRDHMIAWRGYIHDMHTRHSQAYAILTLCRGLYTCRKGEQVSKRRAALWAQEALPEWAGLIQNALVWRQSSREKEVDHAATFPETYRFVSFVIDQVAG